MRVYFWGNDMIGFCPLASGSRGNSIYIGTKNTKVLLDAGITAKSLKERLSLINVAIEELDAIIISHEHGDHIQGLKTLAFKYDIPVIANSATAKAICGIFHECPQFKIFTTGETFEFHDLEIMPFSVKHDAVDPVGFTLKIGTLKIGVCTDLGFVTSNVIHQLKLCDLVYVEANHEPSMVLSSSRPVIYKERVLGPTGHLSNQASGELLTHIYHPGLKQVYLAHLSQECNTRETALHVVTKTLEEKQITLPLTIAEQDRITRATLFD